MNSYGWQYISPFEKTTWSTISVNVYSCALTLPLHVNTIQPFFSLRIVHFKPFFLRIICHFSVNNLTLFWRLISAPKRAKDGMHLVLGQGEALFSCQRYFLWAKRLNDLCLFRIHLFLKRKRCCGIYGSFCSNFFDLRRCGHSVTRVTLFEIMPWKSNKERLVYIWLWNQFKFLSRDDGANRLESWRMQFEFWEWPQGRKMAHPGKGSMQIQGSMLDALIQVPWFNPSSMLYVSVFV